ncbi:MAG TPA: sulfur carrier protein ThiS [Victivallales bacterium]|nr:sulfur carrier protein ThiS [Victivallales bacterium]
MKINLNGEIKCIDHKSSVTQVIKDLNFPNDGLVTLLNENIISQVERNNTILNENDSLEIISFVSGG